MSIINPNIGEVFTPIAWGQFAAKAGGIYQKWLNGSRILDPFMGEGALFLALIDLALQAGMAPQEIPVHRLYGFDWQATHVETFESALLDRGIALPWENFFIVDTFFFDKALDIDIIFTNPPWITFNNLSQIRQDKLKPLFLYYQLVDVSAIIMGGSHVDLAALALTLALDRWAPKENIMVAFIPHSMLTSAAHAPWRKFLWPAHQPLKPAQYFNLSNLKIFPISCDYGLMILNAQNPTVPPLYFKKSSANQSNWEQHTWPHRHILPELYQLSKEQRPRQGVNTSGANNYFIFNRYKELGRALVEVSNEYITTILPKTLVVPLATSENFKDKRFTPKRWIFLPYHAQTGELIPLHTLKHYYAPAYIYLQKIKKPLTNRKGMMLQSYMRRGDFYALLGVGSYAFSPYKVMWQAMGSYEFRSIIVPRHVQGNQALHAYIPAYSKSEAKAIQAYLHTTAALEYFDAFDVAGSKSFAQPHRVSNLFDFT